jgi:hypothetical protein
MSTLFTWTTPDGRQGRCDAHCHDAKTHPRRCTCICGGAFHGTKRNGTFDRVRRLQAQQIIADAQARATKDGSQLIVSDTLYQLELQFSSD